MRKLVYTLRPAAAARHHLLVASLLWSVVGCVLLFFGMKWVFEAHEVVYVWLIFPALVVGILKARMVLFRAADRITGRIIARGDGKCIGGFISWKTWLLVALMIVGGRSLRAWVLPAGASGLLYGAVGIALAYGSTRMWRTWYLHSPE